MSSLSTKILGTVAMEPKGEYSAEAYYEKLNTVLYNDSTYMAKKPSHNILPTDTEYWQFVAGGYESGSTLERPTSNIMVGKLYFDTTLGKPIWYNGTNWVDATGTQV